MAIEGIENLLPEGFVTSSPKRFKFDVRCRDCMFHSSLQKNLVAELTAQHFMEHPSHDTFVVKVIQVR